jgi:hypothetical protein
MALILFAPVKSSKASSDKIQELEDDLKLLDAELNVLQRFSVITETLYYNLGDMASMIDTVYEAKVPGQSVLQTYNNEAHEELLDIFDELSDTFSAVDTMLKKAVASTLIELYSRRDELEKVSKRLNNELKKLYKESK